MRVRMPDQVTLRPYRRWKRGPIVEVATREEVEELVARGGVALPDDEPAATKEPPAPPPPKKKGATKAK